MIESCKRCGRAGEEAPARRVPFPAEIKERVLAAICAGCWAEWEATEIKVINEYRLSFVDPSHRKQLQSVCLEFLGLSQA